MGPELLALTCQIPPLAAPLLLWRKPNEDYFVVHCKHHHASLLRQVAEAASKYTGQKVDMGLLQEVCCGLNST